MNSSLISRLRVYLGYDNDKEIISLSKNLFSIDNFKMDIKLLDTFYEWEQEIANFQIYSDFISPNMKTFHFSHPNSWFYVNEFMIIHLCKEQEIIDKENRLIGSLYTGTKKLKICKNIFTKEIFMMEEYC